MAKMRMNYWFQHTAARRRLADGFCVLYAGYKVSTHSRPKAAGNSRPMALIRFDSFNTQPPEGGWLTSDTKSCKSILFQHTAARRRLVLFQGYREVAFMVSTHSRPKAAGFSGLLF